MSHEPCIRPLETEAEWAEETRAGMKMLAYALLFAGGFASGLFTSGLLYFIWSHV